jgi:hypothetical protein
MKSPRIAYPALISLMALCLSNAPQSAFAKTNIVEIPLKNVFVPNRGFDDNDRVEIVLRGDLPNLCYNLGIDSLEAVPGTRKLKVRHLAFREMSGPCTASDEHLPAEPVAFISALSVGTLDVGTFEIDFGGPAPRSFQVEKAKSDHIDNYRYASLSAVETREILEPGEPVEVVLSGIFKNSCEDFDGPPEAQVQGDVIVILPTLKPIESGQMCLQMIREYKEKVSAGKLPPGEYLVHARSREGRASYRLVTVRFP